VVAFGHPVTSPGASCQVQVRAPLGCAVEPAWGAGAGAKWLGAVGRVVGLCSAFVRLLWASC
jgi:hypothetical protein